MNTRIPALLLINLMCLVAHAQTNITVISWNIRLETESDGPHAWRFRREAVVDFLTKEQPAIIGFQEALHGQVDYLSASLGGYAYVGVGRADGAQEGEYVPLFYDTAMFSLLHSGHFWLSETPDVPGSKGWDAQCERMVSWVRLEPDGSQQTLLVVNTHLDHVGIEARRQSVGMLLDFLTGQADEAVILMGDFNFDPDDTNYPRLAGKLIDARQMEPELEKREIKTYTGFDSKQENDGLVDFIFLGRGLQARSYLIPAVNGDGFFASDHLPVVVGVYLP
ncbi:MAG: endonuclease/exonuclease/phosphatase family protein [Bacteroidales bacterium]|nr:endonuclease/exonuclease/phosphatase family protein [Bacteroidales bacterium]